jgi:hypothetical protein
MFTLLAVWIALSVQWAVAVEIETAKPDSPLFGAAPWYYWLRAPLELALDIFAIGSYAWKHRS